MAKRPQSFDFDHMSRFKVISLAVSIALEDEEDDMILLAGIKRPRVHAFWMRPFLKARTDSRQRNTLAKLEADFLRVSSISY